MSHTTPRTLFRKLWDSHIVDQTPDGNTLLYIDLQLLHEVTSPQAFEGLRMAGRRVRRPDKVFAVQDHNIPTTDRSLPILDPIAKTQIETLQKNCRDFGIKLYDIHDPNQGVVHVVGPERGLTQPGMTIVCGDSHTATHGAFGALAFGIGTSEVEHVLATQTLWQRMPKTFRIHGKNALPPGVSAKDLILYIIGQLGTAGGTGFAVEFTGQPFVELSMEGRMTVSNMAIEMGARSGLIAPDQKTFDYLRGKEFVPTNDAWERAVEKWRLLPSDPGASYDMEWTFDASKIEPMVTWGTNPGQVAKISGNIPEIADFENENDRKMTEAALTYMDLEPGMPICDIKIQQVFIGSCTNGRIEDLRDAAAVAKDKHLAPGVRGMVVPGSGPVKRQAESEGLDKIFTAAGFEWREPGCSMCLAMNPDQLRPGEHCAATNNRNFEGRQGKDGRTHLVSPAMAAAAGIAGHFVDARDFS